MPTVLHVLEAFGGGTERHLLDLIGEVDGFSHVIAVPRSHLGESTGAATDRALSAGAMVEPIEMHRSPSPMANTRALIALRALVRRVHPDIVHGHSSVGGGFARLAAIGSSIPVVYTPNGIKRTRSALAIERLLARGTARFIAVSESEASFALRHELTRGDRLEVIANGIDPSPPAPLRPTLRSRLGIPEGAPLIGSLGRLSWQKAPEVYVTGCAIVGRERSDAHFVLIGSGPEEPRVLRELDQWAFSDRFHHLPSLPGAAAAFEEFDVFVLASRFEGGPYSVLEAMRAGVPVVATQADGTRDAVEPGVTGHLVPLDDPEALAAAIGRLLADPGEREAFGTAGRRRLVERFDVRAMAAATARVYADVAGLDLGSDQRDRGAGELAADSAAS